MPFKANDSINTSIIPTRANSSLITPFLNPTIKNIINSKIIPTSNIFNRQLLKLKLSYKASILIIYVISIAFSAVSVLYITKNPEGAIAVYAVLMILLLFMIFKTDILYKHKNKSKKEDKNNKK